MGLYNSLRQITIAVDRQTCQQNSVEDVEQHGFELRLNNYAYQLPSVIMDDFI
ncbi:MAG: hypothetical protein ACTS7E_02805 [Arsenophonus sp. NC-CH8-MAG3]